MILLQWRATLRFAPYVRAAVGSQRTIFVVWGVAGLALGAWLWSLGLAMLAVEATLGFWAFLVVLLLVSVAQLLGRLRRVHATSTLEQWYTVTPDAVEIALGRDRASIPLSELRVVGSGLDWVAAQRRAMGRRRVTLYFDDPALVPRLVDIVAQRGATQ